MTELLRRGRWVIGAAVLAVAVAFGVSWLRGPALDDDPLALTPADANLVLSVDVGALTGSRVWRALVDEPGGGPRRIEFVCGYDPLEQVERAVVFFYGAQDRPFEHVGFVARGEFARGEDNRRRLVRCVGQVLADQGGATREVEVEGVPAMASASGGSHAAFLGSDGAVGGDREVVARAIRVARGDEPSAARRADLRALHGRVAELDDLQIVARLPDRWLGALRRMAGDMPGELDALASVRALALGARLRDGLEARAVLRTADEARAPSLERALREQVDAALESPETRLSVVGSALRRVDLRVRGRDVLVELRLSPDLVEDLASLWRELREAAAEEPDVPDDAGAGEPEPEVAAPDASVGELDLDDVPVGLDGGAGALVGGSVEPVADPEPGDDPGGEDDQEQQ